MDHKGDDYSHLGVMVLLIFAIGIMFAGFITVAIGIITIVCS